MTCCTPRQIKQSLRSRNAEHLLYERWFLNETDAFTLSQIARNGLQLSKSSRNFMHTQSNHYMTEERREDHDSTIQMLNRAWALWIARVTLWVDRCDDGTGFATHISNRARHRQLMRRFRAVVTLIPLMRRELQDAAHRAYMPGGIGYLECLYNVQRLQRQAC